MHKHSKYTIFTLFFKISSSSFSPGIQSTISDSQNSDIFSENTRTTVQQAFNALSTTSKSLLTLSQFPESEYWNPSIYDDLSKCKQNQANKLGRVFEPEYLLSMIKDVGLAYGYNYATNLALDDVYQSVVSCLEVTNFEDYNLKYINYEFNNFIEQIEIFDEGKSVPYINWYEYGKFESRDFFNKFSVNELSDFGFVQSLVNYKAAQKATFESCRLNSTSKFVDIKDDISKILGRHFETIDEVENFILSASELYFLGKSGAFESKVFDKRDEISEALGSKDGLWKICVEKFKDQADEYGNRVFWSYRSAANRHFVAFSSGIKKFSFLGMICLFICSVIFV